MAEKYNKCRNEDCEKQVKEPFWYCFNCNQERKGKKEQESKQDKIPEETVRDHYPNNNGAEFGLCCNLALRKTLAHFDGTKDNFEENYRRNVRSFWKWNKELRNELT